MQRFKRSNTVTIQFNADRAKIVLLDDVVEAYNLIKDLEPTTPQVSVNCIFVLHVFVTYISHCIVTVIVMCLPW